MANPLVEKLRSYKFTYELYNFFKKKELKHNMPLYRKFGVRKRYFSSVSSEDFSHLKSPLNKYDALDSADKMLQDPDYQNLQYKNKQELLSWSQKGYVVLKNFFSEMKINEVNTTIDALVANGEVSFRYGTKIMFAIHKSKLLYDLGEDPKLKQVLKLLMGKEVELFQSINFFHGSQQKPHSDSIHMTTFPYGNLIAVWVALEDIVAGSGELHYYPGSQKLPYVMNRDFGNLGSKSKLGEKDYHDYENYIQSVIEKNALKKDVFLARKGDILIWHANLLHGGEPVTKPEASRKSMVFHYYTTDAICFHEVTQRPSLKPKRPNV